MVTRYQTSSVSGLLPVDLDLAHGDGVQPIPSKARDSVEMHELPASPGVRPFVFGPQAQW
jgi:acetoin utilization deacetylase AcuC-like enzyme